MKKRWMLWVLISLMSMTAVLAGCGRETKENSHIQEETLETMEEPLRIFYDGTGYYILRSFMDAHPEIKIELINCLPFLAEEFDYKDIVEREGVPDLIIARDELSLYLPELFAEGDIASLTDYCFNDISMNQNDYFADTFEVFKEGENLYALPLGISMEFIVTSESKYNDSAFTKLKDGYTGKELLNVLLEEVQKNREEGEIFSEITMDPFSLLYCLDGFAEVDGSITIDEELFKQLYEFAYKNSKLSDEGSAYWSEQGKSFGGDLGYAFPCALEPRRYEGKFTISMGGADDAPALVLSHAESAHQYYSEEGVKAIYIPTAEDGSKYQGNVKVWGAVGGESERKDLAYELLKLLMDEEINSFGSVWGPIPRGASQHNENVYPINIENAISLLDRFESQTVKLMYGSPDPTILDRTDISEEEKEKHQKMLRGISGLYCWTRAMSEIDDSFEVYADAMVLDYEQCYLDMLNALNADDVS